MTQVFSTGIEHKLSRPSLATVFVLFATMISGALLTGCNKDGGGSAPRTAGPDQGPPIPCEFSFSEGAGNLGIFSEDFKESFFKKIFNANLLKSVQHASAESTLSFIARAGIEIYQAPAMGRSDCQFLSSFANPPATISTMWSKATEGDNPQVSYTLGVFWPSSRTDPQESPDQPNTIVLRQNVDRWTVVHEFMHHNYYESAQALTGYDEAIESRNLNAAIDRLELAMAPEVNLADEANFTTAAIALNEVIDGFISNLTHFTFEEITIEGQLRDLYRSGQLPYVPERAYANGAWYIKASFESAKDRIKKVTTEVELFKNKRLIFGHTNPASSVTGSLTKLADVKNTLLNTVRTLLPSESISWSRKVQIQPKELNLKGCPHDQINQTPELILEKLQNLQRQRL